VARFDVFANPTVAERKHTPYLVDVQNDYIDALATRVVIPLRRESVMALPARNLNPSFTVGTERVVLDTAALAAVPVSALRKSVANLGTARSDIQEALDTLFGAF
jgi:toxin CcdB